MKETMKMFTFFWTRWFTFFEEERKNKEKPSNSIRKQTWFSWRTNGTQSFIGWFLFLSFSIGWTVFITGPKKRKQMKEERRNSLRSS
jgi:cbb3-type cytochrome oxidase subunit 3